jgi:hypothetical protein
MNRVKSWWKEFRLSVFLYKLDLQRRLRSVKARWEDLPVWLAIPTALVFGIPYAIVWFLIMSLLYFVILLVPVIAFALLSWPFVALAQRFGIDESNSSSFVLGAGIVIVAIWVSLKYRNPDHERQEAPHD